MSSANSFLAMLAAVEETSSQTDRAANDNVETRAHSFGHFEKPVLLTARTFTLLLGSARSKKREVSRCFKVLVVLVKARAFYAKS
jgi:hypothetical protein